MALPAIISAVHTTPLVERGTLPSPRTFLYLRSLGATLACPLFVVHLSRVFHQLDAELYMFLICPEISGTFNKYLEAS
jgi:hypothetical protein